MCIYGSRITFVLFAPVPDTGCPMWHAGLTLTLTFVMKNCAPMTYDLTSFVAARQFGMALILRTPWLRQVCHIRQWALVLFAQFLSMVLSQAQENQILNRKIPVVKHIVPIQRPICMWNPQNQQTQRQNTHQSQQTHKNNKHTTHQNNKPTKPAHGLPLWKNVLRHVFK